MYNHYIPIMFYYIKTDFTIYYHFYLIQFNMENKV